MKQEITKRLITSFYIAHSALSLAIVTIPLINLITWLTTQTVLIAWKYLAIALVAFVLSWVVMAILAVKTME